MLNQARNLRFAVVVRDADARNAAKARQPHGINAPLGIEIARADADASPTEMLGQFG